MFLRKITVKHVNGGKNPNIVEVIKSVEDGGQGQFMGRFFCKAEKVITRESQYGDGEAKGLKGVFKAVNAKGESYESTQAFLPGVAHQAIEHALSPNKEGEVPDSVEAVFDIYAARSSRDENKYEYVISPVVAPETKVDPFGHLTNLPPLPGALALPAPAESGAPDAAQAETPAPEPAAASTGSKKGSGKK